MTLTYEDVRRAARLDARARRAARRAGYILRKSRARPSLDNHGEYMLLDAYSGFPVAGYRFDMSAEDVIEFCVESEEEATS